VYDDAVISFIQRLDSHRKKCEAEGRYKEASAASQRLIELKTAQVARMRQQLMQAQTQVGGQCRMQIILDLFAARCCCPLLLHAASV
jgi:hypothetical protein